MKILICLVSQKILQCKCYRKYQHISFLCPLFFNGIMGIFYDNFNGTWLTYISKSNLIETRRYGPLRGLWPWPRFFFALRAKLEDTAHYAGLLLAPAEGFGRGFCSLWAKKEHIMLFWRIFGNVWCPVVTWVTFSSNLSNFERNSKN